MFMLEEQQNIAAFLDAITKPLCIRFQLTQMELAILMFLADNPECDTAAEVVKVCKFTKSHVSSSTRSLEEKGLIERHCSKNDKRSVHLRVTEKAEEIISAGNDERRAFVCQIMNGFTEEEIQQCRQFLLRMCENAEAGLKKIRR